MARRKVSPKSTRSPRRSTASDPAATVGRVLRMDCKAIFRTAEQQESVSSHTATGEAGAHGLQLLRESMTQRLDELLALFKALPIQPSPGGLDPDRIGDRVKAELVAVLPGLIRNLAKEGGPDPLATLRASLRGELAQWWGLRTAVEPPALLRDNRALADRLFLQAAHAGQLFSVSLRQAFDLISQEIRDAVLLRARPNQERDASGQSTLTHGETPAPLQPPPMATPADERLALTLQGAHLHPEANRSFGEVYQKVEQDLPEVGLYNRLLTFAGRSVAEIAALVEESPETIERSLRDFEDVLERNAAARTHEH